MGLLASPSVPSRKSTLPAPRPRFTVWFNCYNVPRPHEDIAFYVFQSFPETGICEIRGRGNKLHVNSFGNEIRDKIDDVARQISAKYGTPKKYDYLAAGSIWR